MRHFRRLVSSRILRRFTYPRVTVILALLGLGFTLLGVGLPAIGFELGSVLGGALVVLGIVCFLGVVVTFFWSPRSEDELKEWRKQIQEWVLEDKPLANAQLDDSRRDLTATRTRALLKKLDPDQKREVLETMAYCNLLDRSSTAVILNKADFSYANLADLHLRNVWLGLICFRKADFTGATFSDFDVSGTNHHIARRMGVPEEDLENPVDESMLWRNDFSGAILKDARLGGCNLAGANFRRANLDGADLRGASLKGAKNLTQKQINKAYGSYGRDWVEDTRSLPSGLKPPEAWRKPIREQKRKMALAKLERAHAGP